MFVFLKEEISDRLNESLIQSKEISKEDVEKMLFIAQDKNDIDLIVKALKK